MQVSYGPPGHKGVTTMMAVGQTEYEATHANRVVNKGLFLAAAAWGVGYILGSKTIKHMGLGGFLALLAVRGVTVGQTVEVEQPAPAATSGLFYVI